MIYIVAEQYPGRDFRRTHRMAPEDAPEGVMAVVGFRSGKTLQIQAWEFNSLWTRGKARKWLNDRNYRVKLELVERPSQLVKNLRAARGQAGLSQIDAGAIAAITPSYLSQIECGRIPSLRVLGMLCLAYHIPPAKLFEDVLVDELLESE